VLVSYAEVFRRHLTPTLSFKPDGPEPKGKTPPAGRENLVDPPIHIRPTIPDQRVNRK
jgi:hypothetical protein